MILTNQNCRICLQIENKKAFDINEVKILEFNVIDVVRDLFGIEVKVLKFYLQAVPN